MSEYKVVCGTYYDAGTPDALVRVLENAKNSHKRIKVHYSTGYSECGYVGRSCGTIKIPLLVHNNRSRGGGALSCRDVVMVCESRGGRVLYRA